MLLQKPQRERGFKKERIIRVLLNQSRSNQGSKEDKQISKYRVAKLAEVSEPWCLEYTGRLEDRGLLSYTEVKKPRELYEEWKEIRIDPNQVSVSFQQPMNFLLQIKEKEGLDYALTSYRAESLIQGFLFPSKTDFYIHPDQIERWEEVVKERGMVGGGNTRIRVTDKHVFYNQSVHENHPIVSVPQVIVDLLEEGGPCEEAAAKLIDSYHGPEA